MVYRHAGIMVLGILVLLILSVQGCSNMKWFNQGSDEQSQAQMGRRRSSLSSGSPSAMPHRSERGPRDQAAGDGTTQDGRDGYPSLSLKASPEIEALDPEGGSLHGLSVVEGDRISGEERLSRSPMGSMLHPVDRNEQLVAELRREEAAAMAAGLEDVFYSFNRWMVQNDGMQALTHNAGWLKEHPKAMLRISGHCDERGSHDYNLVLGEKRAHAAKNVLVELGVSPRQVSIVSYGKDRPFCRESDEGCYRQNRRGHMLLRAE
jgi:peptidoglycan-associated lipoprotein